MCETQRRADDRGEVGRNSDPGVAVHDVEAPLSEDRREVCVSRGLVRGHVDADALGVVAQHEQAVKSHDAQCVRREVGGEVAVCERLRDGCEVRALVERQRDALGGNGDGVLSHEGTSQS